MVINKNGGLILCLDLFDLDTQKITFWTPPCYLKRLGYKTN